MALVAYMAPILPGKRAQWDDFMAQITGPRRAAFDAIHAKVHERTFLQETPMGDVVIVTLEGDDPTGDMAAVFNSNDEFVQWFIQQVQEIHGFDLRQAPQRPPQLVYDSQGGP